MLSDVALERALERLRKNFYHLWRVLEELRSSPRPRPAPDSLLRDWRGAQKPSQEWRKALFYEQAIDVLTVALGVPREDVSSLVREYVFGRLDTSALPD